jgi:glycosyltransferase involved in cell wall biosynthesis
MKLTALILTQNEEKHLARCIRSVQAIGANVVIVDCGSTDSTLAIAKSHGACVLHHAWVNYATQYNWGLAQLKEDTDWVLRIDADEVVTAQLAAEINARLPKVSDSVDGVYFGRRMTFQGRQIRHGGLFPINVLRLFRRGHGRCENRWMDEHIVVDGATIQFPGEIVDDNLNTLTWWTEKHNKYASREAVDLLNLEYRFLPAADPLAVGTQPGAKRWIKEQVYSRSPGGVRAFAYFLYRYVLRLGFLDGRAGANFHFLQGFWYRYLVDAKVEEVKRFMRQSNVAAPEAIEHVLGVRL